MPGHYSQAEARPEEPPAGLTIAAVAGGESAGATGESESRHRRRGERQHYRRKIAGITRGGEHRDCRRGDGRRGRSGSALV